MNPGVQRRAQLKHRFRNRSSAQPPITSSHCFLHYTRDLHLSHIQSMQGHLELCFWYLKEFTWPTLMHSTCALLGFVVCPRNIQPLYPCLFSILSTDGLMELWRYSSHWHATQREVASKQTIALLAQSFSPLGFLISTAS